MQNHWGSLCVMGQEKNHSNKDKDMALQVEQRMLSARHVAIIGLLAVIHSKRWDGRSTNLKCLRGITRLLQWALQKFGVCSIC